MTSETVKKNTRIKAWVRFKNGDRDNTVGIFRWGHGGSGNNSTTRDQQVRAFFVFLYDKYGARMKNVDYIIFYDKDYGDRRVGIWHMNDPDITWESNVF